MGVKALLFSELCSFKFDREANMKQDSGSGCAEPSASGWESVAEWFIRHSADSTVGVRIVELWAQDLSRGASVLDVGCGAGSPRSEALMRKDGQVYAVDASPTLAAAYKQKFPEARVVCQAVEESTLFDIRFDAILAWGLVFLLPPRDQRRLISRFVAALKPRGRLLFTAPKQHCTWNDATTGQPSASMGSESYKALLSSLGAPVVSEYDDEGQNHYYSARKVQDTEVGTRSSKSLHSAAFGGG